ncbi:hypothetical protein ACO2Q3_19305 [Caulobacter sp. KR2-114]|uniref:hypothetical protein n=1 Tax=Caulobacter sp. KR2-114 TaxID=3400912 RepID=UPI003C0A6A6D
MTMRTLRKIELGVLTLAATALTSTLAQAATCGLSDPNGSASLGSYDPFGGAGIPSGPFTLTLHRTNSATAAVDLMFYLPSSGGAYDVKSAGTSIVTHSTNPNLNASNPPIGTLFVSNWDTNGNATVSLTGVVPAGLDQASGTNTVSFDLRYDCKATSGNTSANNQLITTALTMSYSVQSALQASYSGTAFDFGDVSNLNNGQASQRSVSGNVRVASSGPFSVAVAPGSGTAWAMTYPGGNTGTASQRIYYALNFLGQTGSHSNGQNTFDTVTCQRTGVSGQNLPISASLAEATTGKTAAPDYSDYISVTVTPLAAAGSPQNCSTMGQGERH